MNPEDNKNTTDLTKPKNILGNSFSSALFYLSILFFIIGFNFSDRMVGNWYQQFMPDLGGRTIVDMTFTDSLTGYAITSRLSVNDYPKILKTSNSGNNWNIIYNNSDTSLFACLYFLNQNTGYVGGYIEDNFNFSMLKTTNGGVNWNNVNTPFDTYQDDIHALNEDTIWFVMNEATSGGVYFTSNGGNNWIRQYNSLSNPNRIYMYNAKLGFIGNSTSGSNFRRTTNAGASWDFLSNNEGLNDMFFVDSLNGWKIAGGIVKKTNDKGINWISQQLPMGNFIGNGAIDFMNKNEDTIWAVGESIIVAGNPPTRGILYRTTDGGNNWLFQIPDTTIHINRYTLSQFVDKENGWAYNMNSTGIHTTSGGDTTFYLPVNQINSEVPNEFKLLQNFPNPFNAGTKINFKLPKQSFIQLKIFDITGREVSVLINESLNAGSFDVLFNPDNLSSGVYFYSLYAEGKLIETKKMLLIK